MAKLIHHGMLHNHIVVSEHETLQLRYCAVLVSAAPLIEDGFSTASFLYIRHIHLAAGNVSGCQLASSCSTVAVVHAGSHAPVQIIFASVELPLSSNNRYMWTRRETSGCLWWKTFIAQVTSPNALPKNFRALIATFWHLFCKLQLSIDYHMK